MISTIIMPLRKDINTCKGKKVDAKFLYSNKERVLSPHPTLLTFSKNVFRFSQRSFEIHMMITSLISKLTGIVFIFTPPTFGKET